jgi:colicin import membrane protein
MIGSEKRYFVISVISHLSILSVLMLGFAFSQPLTVFQNSDKQDVISAVVLGDTEKSKIVTPKSIPQPTPPLKPMMETKPQLVKPFNKDVVILKPTKPKVLPKPKFLAQDLLEDIQKQHKQKQLKQKELQSHFQQTLRMQAEESLRQQMIKENIRLQAEQERLAQGRINKYVALIQQAMTEHWVIPPQSKQSLKGELMIRLAPGGGVLDVQITTSSGDPALDSSARAAVFKASPLPVPSDPKEFDPFKQFVLKFTPKDVLANSGKTCRYMTTERVY